MRTTVKNFIQKEKAQKKIQIEEFLKIFNLLRGFAYLPNAAA